MSSKASKASTASNARQRLVVSIVFLIAAGCSLPAETSDQTEASATPQPTQSVTTDVVYGHKDGLALTFDVYHPSAPNGAGVISVVSAGWRSSWETMQQFVKTPDGLRPMNMEEIEAVGSYLPAHSYVSLLDKGYTVFALRHGTSPKYPLADIVTDLRRGVRYIRHYASDYDVDAERIGVWGGSAGGHLSLLLATASEPPMSEPSEEFEIEPVSVAAAVAYFPPTDLERFGTSQIRETFPAMVLNSEQAREFSPIRYVSATDPPSLILHGDADETVPYLEGQTMYEALRAAGVTTELITVEGSGHGFYDDDAVRANAAMVDWFERHLN